MNRYSQLTVFIFILAFIQLVYLFMFRSAMSEPSTNVGTHNAFEDIQGKENAALRSRMDILQRQIDKLKDATRVATTGNQGVPEIRQRDGSNFPKMKRAVAVYFHDGRSLTKDFLKELKWLHECWDLITNEYVLIDLFIFTDPQSADVIPKEWECVPYEKVDETKPNCIIVEHTPPNTETFRNYKNLYSLEFFASEDGKVLDDYDLVMRTDIDVFLTPFFGSWFPQGFVVGKGGYGYHIYTQRRLRRIAKKLGLTHRGMHNLGPTWYGPGKRIREVAELSMKTAIYIWENELDEPTIWPKWWKTAVMYGSEIALNHLVPDLIYSPELIDVQASEKNMNVYKLAHIHAMHTAQPFNKFVFQRGCYDNMNVTGLDFTKVPEYCVYMALRGNKLIKPVANAFPLFPRPHHPVLKNAVWPKINYNTLLTAQFKCPTK